MSDPKECRYCRTIANGSDEPCGSLVHAKDCPWMSTSDWKVLDDRAAAASAEPVADTWLVGGPPDLKAMSGDTEDERVIRLHFRRKATEQDRAWLLDAINTKLASHPAPDAEIVAALEPFIRAAKIIAKRPQDYKDRIATIGGLADASDLTKRHFAELLAALAKAKGGSQEPDGGDYMDQIYNGTRK